MKFNKQVLYLSLVSFLAGIIMNNFFIIYAILIMGLFLYHNNKNLTLCVIKSENSSSRSFFNSQMKFNNQVKGSYNSKVSNINSRLRS